jgi:hypothetical protein
MFVAQVICTVTRSDEYWGVTSAAFPLYRRLDYFYINDRPVPCVNVTIEQLVLLNLLTRDCISTKTPIRRLHPSNEL